MEVVNQLNKQISLITLKEVRGNPKVKAYIEGANELLKAIGYTEHGFRHAGIVAAISKNIILQLGYSPRQAELTAIAGFLHDVGNVINRPNHPEIGGMMTFKLLEDMNVDPKEIALIIGAIGNHEELHGQPVNWMSAAVIIADKSDVHYSRVQNSDLATFDIHDRVNHAVNRSRVNVVPEDKVIELELQIDPAVASVMEYFEIFLGRMLMCHRAAELLGCKFKLNINGVHLG